MDYECHRYVCLIETFKFDDIQNAENADTQNENCQSRIKSEHSFLQSLEPLYKRVFIITQVRKTLPACDEMSNMC